MSISRSSIALLAALATRPSGVVAVASKSEIEKAQEDLQKEIFVENSTPSRSARKIAICLALEASPTYEITCIPELNPWGAKLPKETPSWKIKQGTGVKAQQRAAKKKRNKHKK